MRRILVCCLVLCVADAQIAQAQQYPQWPDRSGKHPADHGQRRQEHPSKNEIPSTPLEVKPEKAAAKAYAAGQKIHDQSPRA